MRKYQRGYAALPYLSAFFVGAAPTAAAGLTTAATIGSAVGTAGLAIGAAKVVGGLASKPGQIAQAPGAPTIDLAANAQQQSDRLAKRRGVLANIYGGSGSAPASVGRQTLGG